MSFTPINAAELSGPALALLSEATGCMQAADEMDSLACSAWYMTHVGHDPLIDEPDLPLAEFRAQVAGMMLLHALPHGADTPGVAEIQTAIEESFTYAP